MKKINNIANVRALCAISACALLYLLDGCAKSKIEQGQISLLYPEKITSSVVRFINQTGLPLDLSMDSIRLTNYVGPYQTAGLVNPAASPTKYFPSSGKWSNNSAFTLPLFLAVSGRPWVGFNFTSFSGSSPGIIGSFVDSIKYDPSQPTDYFFTATNFPGYIPGLNPLPLSVRSFPRSVTPDVKKDHFKIRIVNLSSAYDPVGLTGDVTLRFADSTLVSQELSNVPSGVATPYVSLPYGSYHFRLFNSSGQEFPQVGAAADPGHYNSVSPDTKYLLGQPYAILMPLHPGGIYTILVSSDGEFSYNTSDQTVSISVNAYQYLVDQTPGVNLTYAKIQTVNAYLGNTVWVNIDGIPSDTISYSSSSSFHSVAVGRHRLTVTDSSGAQLLSQDIVLSAYDDQSLWLYADSFGHPRLTMVANNLSNTFYQKPYINPFTNNLTGSTLNAGGYTDNVRFLNLCPDVPFLTFTDNDQLISPSNTNFSGTGPAYSPQSTENLPFGKLPDQLPNVIFQFPFVPPVIRAYASSPNPFPVLPGYLISSVKPLVSAIFKNQPGVFTVALVGRVNPTGGQPAAKLIVIKNSQ